MVDTITITKGRNRETGEQDFSGPDGTYEMTLVNVSDPVTEKSSLETKRGDGSWTYRDWTFAVSDGGEYDGQVLDVRANARSTGPKSKQYGIIVALFGRTPPVGTEIHIKRHLVGRSCYCQILTNDAEFPYIATFMPLPTKRGAAPEPKPEPVAVGAASNDDDPPF